MLELLIWCQTKQNRMNHISTSLARSLLWRKKRIQQNGYFDRYSQECINKHQAQSTNNSTSEDNNGEAVIDINLGNQIFSIHSWTKQYHTGSAILLPFFLWSKDTQFTQLLTNPKFKPRITKIINPKPRHILQELVNLVTALVPSETACLANSPGSTSLTAVWISREVIVGFLL